MSITASKDTLASNRGRYDQLYSAKDFLWPAVPGRMVVQACSVSSPGVALDAGCGDGKNTAFMVENGWNVDAFDISTLALSACMRRLNAKDPQKFTIWQSDCAEFEAKCRTYDAVISYGLYHCLDDISVEKAHTKLTAALRPGGLFIYSAFNDNLNVPEGHGTGDIFLRSETHILDLLSGWIVEKWEVGLIEEDHFPIIGQHEHALTWGIFRKPL